MSEALLNSWWGFKLIISSKRFVFSMVLGRAPQPGTSGGSAGHFSLSERGQLAAGGSRGSTRWTFASE
jgi:hypothetical protein